MTVCHGLNNLDSSALMGVAFSPAFVARVNHLREARAEPFPPFFPPRKIENIIRSSFTKVPRILHRLFHFLAHFWSSRKAIHQKPSNQPFPKAPSPSSAKPAVPTWAPTQLPSLGLAPTPPFSPLGGRLPWFPTPTPPPQSNTSFLSLSPCPLPPHSLPTPAP